MFRFDCNYKKFQITIKSLNKICICLFFTRCFYLCISWNKGVEKCIELLCTSSHSVFWFSLEIVQIYVILFLLIMEKFKWFFYCFIWPWYKIMLYLSTQNTSKALCFLTSWPRMRWDLDDNICFWDIYRIISNLKQSISTLISNIKLGIIQNYKNKYLK